MGDQDFRNIRKLAIIAAFSDDVLLEKLVLKGGNALDLIHGVSFRGSVDLDFSMEDDFSEEEFAGLGERLEKSLRETFESEGYRAFDVRIEKRPPNLTTDAMSFWGGYQIEFKVIEHEQLKAAGNDLDKMRRWSTVVAPGDKKKFRIDISKAEWCGAKRSEEIDGYTIYVYTPEMIVIEKIRAICQQMPEYGRIVHSTSQSPRARDFFDIYELLKKFPIDLTREESLEMVRSIFEAKRVPLEFIGAVESTREFHRQGFEALRDTVRPDADLRDFDFYFDRVVEICNQLESLWKV